MIPKTKIQKLTGKAYFMYGNLHLLNDATSLTPTDVGMSTISRAIIDGNKLNFDLESNADLYGGVAKCFIYKKDDKVLGKASYTGEKSFQENIEGSIFYNTGGCVIFGNWFVDNQAISFIAELKYVKSFPDEKSINRLLQKSALPLKKAVSKK